MYCPLEVIVPAPELASPPETDQVTEAAPPLLSVAENCSTTAPEEVAALQPVQLVSIESVVGEMENVPFDVVVEATPPPQPASTRNVGSAAIASIRAGQRPRNDPNLPALLTFRRRRRSAVTDVLSLNSFSAFPLARAPQARWTRFHGSAKPPLTEPTHPIAFSLPRCKFRRFEREKLLSGS